MEQAILDYGTAAEILNKVCETENIRQMYIAFNGLKGELKVDGNKWCATTGEWPQHNISAFGENPANAMHLWYNEYFKAIS